MRLVSPSVNHCRPGDGCTSPIRSTLFVLALAGDYDITATWLTCDRSTSDASVGGTSMLKKKLWAVVDTPWPCSKNLLTVFFLHVKNPRVKSVEVYRRTEPPWSEMTIQLDIKRCGFDDWLKECLPKKQLDHIFLHKDIYTHI